MAPPSEPEDDAPTAGAAPLRSLRESHYREKLAHRARGLRDLERLVGGICDDIDARLARRGTLRILELGCGYGTALLELRARYGARLELHGLNRLPSDGAADVLYRNAVDHDLLGEGEAARAPWPTILHADVAAGLPYADDSFDLVYSQVAWLYFGNKIGVVREIMRVLCADGIAKIDADETHPALPPEYARLVEIWDDGRLLPFGDYLRAYHGAFARAPEGEYLRFGKANGFGGDLMPIFEIDVAAIHPGWDGTKCTYRRLRPSDGDLDGNRKPAPRD
jgi:SAM-dependent methyltransferase